MPHRCGPVTAMAAFVATAASTAFPPRARISSPACVASWSARGDHRTGSPRRRSGCAGRCHGRQPTLPRCSGCQRRSVVTVGAAVADLGTFDSVAALRHPPPRQLRIFSLVDRLRDLAVQRVGWATMLGRSSRFCWFSPSRCSGRRRWVTGARRSLPLLSTPARRRWPSVASHRGWHDRASSLVTLFGSVGSAPRFS